MKLTTIGCIFYFDKSNDDGSETIPVEVHFAPSINGNWAVAIHVDKKVVNSFGTALDPKEWTAHNIAWEQLSTDKNSSNEKTNTTDQP